MGNKFCTQISYKYTSKLIVLVLQITNYTSTSFFIRKKRPKRATTQALKDTFWSVIIRKWSAKIIFLHYILIPFAMLFGQK